MPTLAVCDPDWSTGSIVKDLQVVLPHQNLKMWSWSTYLQDTPSETLLCFTLTTAARWPSTRTENAIHICCHPHETELPEVLEYAQTRPNIFLGAVSYGALVATQKLFSGNYVHFLPATVLKKRFNRCSRPGKRIAGFVGVSTPQNMQVTGNAKRPELFLDICNRYGFTPKFSNKDYSYQSISEFYKSIDVLICCSTEEGGPLGPFEAAMCGVPVISTKVGLWGESGMGGYYSEISQLQPLVDSLPELASYQYAKVMRIGMEDLAPIWDSALTTVKARNHARNHS